MEERVEEESSLPQLLPDESPPLPFIEASALNKDGMKQYSLTPHPNALPEGVVEDIVRHSSALLRSRSKERIIRFVSIIVYGNDNTVVSTTPGKSIINPPSADYLINPFADKRKHMSWQINLSPEDPIRATPFPAEGNVTLHLKQHNLTGDFDSLNFYNPNNPTQTDPRSTHSSNFIHSTHSTHSTDIGFASTSSEPHSTSSNILPYYLIPIVDQETEQPHELFNNVRIFVSTTDFTQVLKVFLVYLPGPVYVSKGNVIIEPVRGSEVNNNEEQKFNLNSKKIFSSRGPAGEGEILGEKRKRGVMGLREKAQEEASEKEGEEEEEKKEKQRKERRLEETQNTNTNTNANNNNNNNTIENENPNQNMPHDMKDSLNKKRKSEDVRI
jgi:hypothetical protein